MAVSRAIRIIASHRAGLRVQNGCMAVRPNSFDLNSVHVIADDGFMQVVIENLLGNARKYTSKLGSAEIEFGYTEEPAGTVYFVRDDGAGFNPRYADRLFRPFQRLHSQSEFTGTGVGLATACRIITRHGGKIWAKENLDSGCHPLFYSTLCRSVTPPL
jgi:light-regulated signal transduction histidine kinase (bacteriophytochrome)